MRILVGFAVCLHLAAGVSHSDESFTHASAVFEKGSDGKSVVIAVNGLGDVVLKACAAREAKSSDWQKGARVQIGGGSPEDLAQRAGMLGIWRVVDRSLCFEPRFPFLAGSMLRVTVDPPLLTDPSSPKSNPLVFDLQMPKPDLTPVTKLDKIYPTRSELPENQLRFYLHFSQAMTRGEAYEHVRLLDAKGKPIDDVFLELGQELWDLDMKRFTLLFHPGRVKKGLQPREELGPILEAGKKYTLVVSGKWKDAEGRELVQKEFRKPFTAGPADEVPIDPKKWKIIPPPAATKTAFQVRFNESLDHGLLQRVIWIVDADGKKVPGTIEVAEQETLWKFTPEQTWKRGKYHLVADTILEDLAANRIGRAFEVDVFRPIPKSNEAKTVELGFEIR